MEATLTKHDDPDVVAKYSKHCGWCTKYTDTARSYLKRGDVYTIKKQGKRRPSVQLFVTPTTFELKRKGNESVVASVLMKEFPDLSDEISALLAPAQEHVKQFIADQGEYHASNGAVPPLVTDYVNLVDVLDISQESFIEQHETIFGIDNVVRDRGNRITIRMIATENRDAIQHIELGRQFAFRCLQGESEFLSYGIVSSTQFGHNPTGYDEFEFTIEASAPSRITPQTNS